MLKNLDKKRDTELYNACNENPSSLGCVTEYTKLKEVKESYYDSDGKPKQMIGFVGNTSLNIVRDEAVDVINKEKDIRDRIANPEKFGKGVGIHNSAKGLIEGPLLLAGMLGKAIIGDEKAQADLGNMVKNIPNIPATIQKQLDDADKIEATNPAKAAEIRSKLFTDGVLVVAGGVAVVKGIVKNSNRSTGNNGSGLDGIPRVTESNSKVKWVDENASMSDRAKLYDESAIGSRSNNSTKAGQAPSLERTLADGTKRKVRFDGVEGNVLIDRKLSVVTSPKAKNQVARQSEALKENGLTGRWEVPNKAQAKRAQKMFDDLDVTNIEVKIVPE